jgi:hypothetical protein
MKTNSSAATIGIDLGDKKHSICVLGANGKVLSESTITNSREAMTRLPALRDGEPWPGPIPVAHATG